MYATPIWFPNASRSMIQKLQSIQNSSLCVATGCVKMTSIDHLHKITKIFPVDDHLSLLRSQCLARALKPSNSSHRVVNSPSGVKNMK